MERVGIRELRQNASEWVRRAGAGERIEVTSRGVVVALLVPAPGGDRIDELEASGRLRATTHRGSLPAPLPAPGSASQALADLRSDER
jgi:prevent-host-death family protein